MLVARGYAAGAPNHLRRPPVRTRIESCERASCGLEMSPGRGPALRRAIGPHEGSAQAGSVHPAAIIGPPRGCCRRRCRPAACRSDLVFQKKDKTEKRESWSPVNGLRAGAEGDNSMSKIRGVLLLVATSTTN